MSHSVVEQEPATITWYAVRLGPTTFGIFDALPDDTGRRAHLAGGVAAPLLAQTPELFQGAPTIEPAHHRNGGAQMRVRDLQRLYDYHYWATQQLLGVVAQLTPEQFTRSVAGSYGSIRNTLVHVLSAEWGWLDRCGGPRRGERLNPQDFPEVEALTRAWARVEGYVRAFLSGLGDADLSRDIAFAIGGGRQHSVPLGDLMQHAAVHAMHHRGQAALLLRMLGYVPGNFDFLLYLGERRSVPAPHVRHLRHRSG